jgi:hypothetical protein
VIQSASYTSEFKHFCVRLCVSYIYWMSFLIHRYVCSRWVFCKLAQIYSLIVLIEMIKRYYHDGHYSIKVYDCALAVESLR